MAKFLDVIGYTQTIAFLVGIIILVVVFLRGILPALWRLGNGLAKRKIALFAKGDNVSSLRHLLLDSKLFKAKKIIDITCPEDVGRAQMANLYLVYWHDWANDIDLGDFTRNKCRRCRCVVAGNGVEQLRERSLEMEKARGMLAK